MRTLERVRLVSLDARWMGEREPSSPRLSRPSTHRHGMGLFFLCPYCREDTIRIGFSNPLDGGDPVDLPKLWQRFGETFETLTVDPSINATGCCVAPCPGWHGWLRGGSVGTFGR